MWTSTVKVPPFSVRIHSYSTRTCCMTNASPRHLLSLQTGCKNSARWLSRAAARRSGGRGGDDEDSGFLVWNEEVKFFERLLPPGAGVTCGSMEDEVKSEALHRRWLEVKMRRCTLLEHPFGCFITDTHYYILPLSVERGGKWWDIICFWQKRWLVLRGSGLSCSAKYLPLYRFPQLHILYMCMCVYILYIYRLIQK